MNKWLSVSAEHFNHISYTIEVKLYKDVLKSYLTMSKKALESSADCIYIYI